MDGDKEGDLEGSDEVGELVGELVGLEVVGSCVGATEGDTVGSDDVGDKLGDMVGSEVVGEVLGERVGSELVGEVVGDTLGYVVLGELVGLDVGAQVVSQQYALHREAYVSLQHTLTSAAISGHQLPRTASPVRGSFPSNVKVSGTQVGAEVGADDVGEQVIPELIKLQHVPAHNVDSWLLQQNASLADRAHTGSDRLLPGHTVGDELGTPVVGLGVGAPVGTAVGVDDGAQDPSSQQVAGQVLLIRLDSVSQQSE